MKSGYRGPALSQQFCIRENAFLQGAYVICLEGKILFVIHMCVQQILSFVLSCENVPHTSSMESRNLRIIP